MLWRALALSSKNISSWELAEWAPPTPPPGDNVVNAVNDDDNADKAVT